MSPARAVTSLRRAATVWARRRGGVRGVRTHDRLEQELRAHARELRDSRARLAQVADEERRRIERDLHDGCQQHLIALRIKLALAEELVGDENDSVARLIHEISEDATSALLDLQALVHGIYPSVLVDRGLAAAFKGIGRSAPMTVRVFADSARYPPDVEAAVYFAVAEALQNTAKHAGTGATARVTLSHERSRLSFEVRDDGCGFAGDVNAGRGLANMDDRLRAVGGRLRVSSRPGAGPAFRGPCLRSSRSALLADLRTDRGVPLRT